LWSIGLKRQDMTVTLMMHGLGALYRKLDMGGSRNVPRWRNSLTSADRDRSGPSSDERILGRVRRVGAAGDTTKPIGALANLPQYRTPASLSVDDNLRL